MATFIESVPNYIDAIVSSRPNSSPLGYLNIKPETALRTMILEYNIVGYCGIVIPYCGDFSDLNCLRLSEIPDGAGLVGTIEALMKNKLFRRSHHDRLTVQQTAEIVEELRGRIKGDSFSGHYFTETEIATYEVIFSALGSDVSEKEIYDIITNN